MLFRKKKEALEDGNTASPVNSNIHEYKLTKSIKNLKVSHSLSTKVYMNILPLNGKMYVHTR